MVSLNLVSEGLRNERYGFAKSFKHKSLKQN
jgi:hypothetical protein